MASLRILYLHDNNIKKWDQMYKLEGLQNIIHITLFGNPCTLHEGYRPHMVNSIPTLKALDKCIITDEERIEGCERQSMYWEMHNNVSITEILDLVSFTF